MVSKMSRRKKVMSQLLKILEKRNIIKNVSDMLTEKLGIKDKKEVDTLLHNLTTLDQNFNRKNWNTFKSHVRKIILKTLIIEGVKSLENIDKPEEDIVYAKKNGEVNSGAFGKVLMETKYKGKDTVVKQIKSTQKIDIVLEAIINIFVCAVFRNTEKLQQYISSPDVLTMGMAKSKASVLIVQEKVQNTIPFYNLEARDLKEALSRLCSGLSILQLTYNFAHRDFHGNNVLYNSREKRAYIIDFGNSCFSVPQTDGSIQTVDNRLWNQFKQPYQKKCVNKSIDICTLILALVDNDENYKNKAYEMEQPWIYELARDICKKYYNAFETTNFNAEDKQRFRSMDVNVRNAFNGIYAWGEPIFHPWYCFVLGKIEIDVTPEFVKTYIESAFTANKRRKMNALQLKF